jgi:ferrous iron transport protein B
LVASGDFTPASALAFLVFILLYLPCIATIVAIAAEIGWRWACISVLYNTVLAWIMAYLTYHLFSWL